jgi:histidyl-tRNA synthetase
MSVEALGSEQPRLDAEVIAMAAMIIRELGLSVSLEINSLGCRACRPGFNQALVDFLGSCTDLCGDCERRRQTNPLRVLDCKNEKCQAQYTNAPSIPDFLCQGCAEHFSAVKKGLDLLDTPYKVNPFMVRGLDYYTRTTFELITGDLGAQSAVGAGGRYDGLVEQLGGPALPGIGFAMGMERLTLLLALQESTAEAAGIDVFIAALGDKALDLAYRITNGLRVNGLSAAMDLEGRGLKNQMKQAGKQAAKYVLILGEDELANGRGVLRNMASREQEEIELPGEMTAWCRALADKIKQS